MSNREKRFRLTVALAALCATGAAFAGLTSRSYVQRGLAVQYDGISNAGHDALHDPLAATWADLTGHGIDGTVTNAVTWVENGWTYDGADAIKPVTVGSGLAAAIAGAGAFSAQMTVTPAGSGSIRCLLGQNPSQSNACQFNIERKSDDNMTFYAGSPLWKRTTVTLPVYDGTFHALTFSTEAGERNYTFTFHDGAAPNAVVSNGTTVDAGSGKALGFSANCESVVGGYTGTGDDWTFHGTYHAFRLYTRELTDDEIKVNAAVDAIRFNGANAEDFTLGGGWSFDVNGDMCVRLDVDAGSSVFGKVSVDGGEAAESASVVTAQHSVVSILALPAKGYVFDRWTGDTGAITSGSALTPGITVALADPVSLTPVFSRNGNALDGLVFDLDLDGDGVVDASDRIGNAMKFSAEDAGDAYEKEWSQDATYGEYGPCFRTMDVAAPMAPATTNSQKCLYFPQQVVADDTVFNSRVALPNDGIMGDAATFFIRFKWEDGALADDKQCNIALLMNGCNDTYWTNKKGFGLTIRTYAGYPQVGYLDVVGNGQRGNQWDKAIQISPGSWTDCFMSVYPSPTSPELSNADIWVCKTPALNGTAFGQPSITNAHHFGDSAGLGRFTASAATYAGLRFGSERADVHEGSSYRSTAFRGAIAAVKGWDRLLTTNEMWCVMAGRYGGTFSAGVRNDSADEFAGEDAAEAFNPETMPWRMMKKSLYAGDRTLAISVPLPAGSAGTTRILEIAPLFDGVGDRCDVAVSVNGTNVGTYNLVKESHRTIFIRKDFVAAGANGMLNISITRPERCAGTLSFDAISMLGGWQLGLADGSQGEMTSEGRGVPQTAVAGDPVCSHVQRSLTKTHPWLTLLFDRGEGVTKGLRSRSARHAYTYLTRFISPREGYDQPVHLELNGETVFESANVEIGSVLSIPLPEDKVVPGLNELTWRYDAGSSNWVQFDFHRMTVAMPHSGTVITLK